MRGLVLAALMLCPLPASAGLVAAHDLPVGMILTAADLVWSDGAPAGISDPDHAIGRQVRVTIYAGRPVTAGALRAPVLVSRNQLVRIAFDSGGLRIETAGRALSEGAAGDLVRVMNLSSRSTISAVVAPDGTLIANATMTELK
ncbi:MAG: flagellar basal body P-ring formation chaperone FlgA [Paracoccus sp. (in: a-proteobacteria)]|nr:flagellar basal body P-ring formation chaperone FlgA [Paracoccus sp. (in: a-proteobacteria)]